MSRQSPAVSLVTREGEGVCVCERERGHERFVVLSRVSCPFSSNYRDIERSVNGEREK
jgi:hypothetical protein